MNSLKNIIYFREQVVRALREFLYSHDYLEADVPVLSPSLIPESYLEVFQTRLKDPQGNGKTGYLTASPEAYLKRLLVSGSGNIFYLGKAFRNGEPLGKTHNHEFTILEWYHVGYDYQQLMSEIEQMINFVAEKVNSDIGINFSSPWEYLTINQAQKRFVIGKLTNSPYSKQRVKNLKQRDSSASPQNDNELFEKNYVQFIEPNLGTRSKPTFITDFPSWQSPLAKTKSKIQISKSQPNPKSQTAEIAQRFEMYIKGVELINGWTELTDWKIQKANLEQEQVERKKMGKTPYEMDYGFIESLKQKMPECAGAAMGVDRLIMVLGGFEKLEDVILFPTRKLFK